MAIKTNQTTTYGEICNLYVRLNNTEASNHGVKAVALFRGWLSEDAFKSGKGFVFEKSIEINLDVSKPLWQQAYAALKTIDGFEDSVDC